MKYFNFPKKSSFLPFVLSLATIFHVSLGFSQVKPFMQKSSGSSIAISFPTINLSLNNGDQQKSTKIVYFESATLEADPGFDAGAFPDFATFSIHSGKVVSLPLPIQSSNFLIHDLVNELKRNLYEINLKGSFCFLPKNHGLA